MICGIFFGQESNEDILDLVRLTLEMKQLQWKKEGTIPEIPLLLRQSEQASHSCKSSSNLLDLWRLWHQEIDTVGLEYSSTKLLQLIAEAENLPWEPSVDDGIQQHSSQLARDNELNEQLICEVNTKLKELNRSLDVDPSDVQRLEREVFLLSCMSS